MVDHPSQPPSSTSPSGGVSRRGFLQGAALALGATATGGIAPRPASAGAPRGPGTGVPMAYVPPGLARHIVQESCSLCVLGDSIATDSSSRCNLSHGIQRTWRPRTWAARFGRVEFGPPAWAIASGYDSFYYGEPTNGQFHIRVPGAPFGGGEQFISPNNASDWRFGSTDVPDFGPMLLDCKLNDGRNYAVGDWAASVPIRGRLVHWWGGPHMVDSLLIRGKRDWALISSSPAQMAGGPGTFRATDVECGNGAGQPIMEITSNPGVDERGKRAYWFGAGFYRHDGNGTPIPGFGLMQIGEAGWQTIDHLSNWRCSPRALSSFLSVTLRPSTFLLHVGANLTQEEMGTLNDGLHQYYQANVRAIINRYTDAALRAGGRPPIRWILVGPYPMGLSAVHEAAKARALHELAMDDPDHRAFIDLSRIAASRPSGGFTSWYTGDGIHPTADGAAYLAGLIWSQIVAAL